MHSFTYSPIFNIILVFLVVNVVIAAQGYIECDMCSVTII